jgi:hypothetical protein
MQDPAIHTVGEDRQVRSPGSRGFHLFILRVFPNDMALWLTSAIRKFEVPAIPGCATQGETFDELLGNIYEAVKVCLSVDIAEFTELVMHTLISL